MNISTTTRPVFLELLTAFDAGMIAPAVILSEAEKPHLVRMIADHFFQNEKIQIGICVNTLDQLADYITLFKAHFPKKRISIMGRYKCKLGFDFNSKAPIQLSLFADIIKTKTHAVNDILIFDDFQLMGEGEYAQLVHKYRDYEALRVINFTSTPLQIKSQNIEIPFYNGLKTAPVNVILFDYVLTTSREPEAEQDDLPEPNFYEYWDNRHHYATEGEALIEYITELHHYRLKNKFRPKWCIFEIAGNFLKENITPDNELLFAMYQIGYGPYTDRPELYSIADIEAMAKEKNNPKILDRMMAKIAEVRESYPFFIAKKKAEIDKLSAQSDN